MTIIRVDTVVDDQEYGLQAGEWQYEYTKSTGPILFQMSKESGGTFRTMTDGSINATQDGTFKWGQGNVFKAQLGAGDTLTLARIGD